MKKCQLLILFGLLITAATAWAGGEDSNWMSEAYGKSLCHQPDLHCINVNKGDTWQSKFPDPRLRAIVQRLNRTNVALHSRSWLIVPNNSSHVDYMTLGPFAAKIEPPGEKLLIVDLSVFAFAAYNAAGELVYWGPATGGKPWCADSDQSCLTAAGTYQIYRMQGAECVSSQYPLETGGASMPYCMHYYQGYALHGFDMHGFVNRSHGCVHLFVEDAKWLQDHFVVIGTRVMVRL